MLSLIILTKLKHDDDFSKLLYTNCETRQILKNKNSEADELKFWFRNVLNILISSLSFFLINRFHFRNLGVGTSEVDKEKPLTNN